jgi:hypothetical protein
VTSAPSVRPRTASGTTTTDRKPIRRACSNCPSSAMTRRSSSSVTSFSTIGAPVSRTRPTKLSGFDGLGNRAVMTRCTVASSVASRWAPTASTTSSVGPVRNTAAQSHTSRAARRLTAETMTRVSSDAVIAAPASARIRRRRWASSSSTLAARSAS